VTTSPAIGRFTAELRAICGPEHVVDDPAELQRHQVLGASPHTSVTPGSADEIVAILHFANEHGLNIVPAGGFTQQQTGNPPARVDVLLSTARLTEVEHYDPGDLTVGVGAGYTVAHLSAMVGKDGLFFAADPPLPQQATIGGLLATGMTGPYRQGYGGLRDYCIGVRFVTGDGRKGKGGGRVVKNVAGYDMMKLLIGSQGTLGVITSASFKLFPAPRQTRTYVSEFASSSGAVEFRDHLLRSPLDPLCLELVSPQAGEFLPGFDPDGPWLLLLRAAGSDAVLSRYRAELGGAVSREIEGQSEQDVGRALADFSHLVDERHPRSLLVSLSLPLRDVQGTLNHLATVAESNGFTFACIGRVGVGQLLAALWPRTDADLPPANFVNTVSGLRSKLPQDASLAVLRCPPETHKQIPAWGPTPTDEKSMRAVKMALDPRDILNRGRFLF
jgi:glycolate oxidase FAD binding subunit